MVLLHSSEYIILKKQIVVGKQSIDSKNDSPKSYTSSYGDKYAGVRVKVGRQKIVVTKQEFISYITQVMYTHSRQLTVGGIDRLSDGAVIQPIRVGNNHLSRFNALGIFCISSMTTQLLKSFGIRFSKRDGSAKKSLYVCVSSRSIYSASLR